MRFCDVNKPSLNAYLMLHSMDNWRGTIAPSCRLAFRADVIGLQLHGGHKKVRIHENHAVRAVVLVSRRTKPTYTQHGTSSCHSLPPVQPSQTCTCSFLDQLPHLIMKSTPYSLGSHKRRGFSASFLSIQSVLL